MYKLYNSFHILFYVRPNQMKIYEHEFLNERRSIYKIHRSLVRVSHIVFYISRRSRTLINVSHLVSVYIYTIYHPPYFHPVSFILFYLVVVASRYLSFSLCCFSFLQLLPSVLPSSNVEVGHVSILYSIKLASIPAPNNEKRPVLPPSLLGSPTP